MEQTFDHKQYLDMLSHLLLSQSIFYISNLIILSVQAKRASSNYIISGDDTLVFDNLSVVIEKGDLSDSKVRIVCLVLIILLWWCKV